LSRFSLYEQELIYEAVTISEELVNNYYKMSSSEWLKGRYEIKTAKNLSVYESVKGPLAQVVKYKGKRKDSSLSSNSISFYTVCLQDDAILKAVKDDTSLSLYPFLVYIITHELVHIVRFLKFYQLYEVASEEELTISEERKVHTITWEILKAVSLDSLENVFDYHKKWRIVSKS